MKLHLGVVCLLTCAVAAQSAIIPIAAGSATSGDGITGIGGYATKVTVTYQVDQYGLEDVEAAGFDTIGLALDSYYRYSYTFEAKQDRPATKAKAFSHMLLSLSDGCASDAECIFGIDPNFSTLNLIKEYSSTSQGNSNPGLTDPLYGVKFDSLNVGTTFIVSFFSNRQIDPNGRIYGKGGQDYFQSEAGKVATPDTFLVPQGDGPTVPEPMSMSLIGGGLVGLALWRRKFRR